jgi:phospholipid-translocating ATPase
MLMQGLAFVLDGWALELILKHSKESFTRLAMLSKTAICCRMTPLQKAQVYLLLFIIVFNLPFDLYINP